MTKIGIPQGLFFHYYYPLWRSFFNELGAEVIVSAPTNKKTVDLGIKFAVDEACLPVKIYYGHALELSDKVDRLFVPRLVSIKKKEYICPKFMGLPDMLKKSCPDLPPLIDTLVNFNTKRPFWQAIWETGKLLSANPLKIRKAWERAEKQQLKYLELLRAGFLPQEARDKLAGKEIDKVEKGKTIALLGHNYNLYDNYSSMNLVGKLRKMGAKVVTADLLPEETITAKAEQLPKRIFWTLGRRITGSCYYFLGRPEVKGIIHVASFGCGPDSLTGDLVERIIRRDGQKAFLSLTIDEHTGEAGVNTRLEAFMDMIEWREAQ